MKHTTVIEMLQEKVSWLEQHMSTSKQKIESLKHEISRQIQYIESDLDAVKELKNSIEILKLKEKADV